MEELTYTTYHVRVGANGDVDVVVGEGGDRPQGKFQGDKAALARARATMAEAKGPEVTEVGQALFNALFDAELGLDFRRRLEDSQRLRIALEFDETAHPEIAALPWEFMCAPALERWSAVRLGTDPRLTLYRHRPMWQVAEPLEVTEPLRVQFVVANPPDRDLGPVAYHEVFEVLRGLESQCPPDLLSPLPDPLTQASAETLDQALRYKPHILHFIGHGELRGASGDEHGALALTHPRTGMVDWQRGERVAEIFTRHRPSLVVLQTCESGRLGSGRAFAGVASQLVHQNMPAVVAMQFAISNDAALRFAEVFYRRLLLDLQPVDVAVQEARQSLWRNLDRGIYGAPVLFMRARDGRLFVKREVEQPPQAVEHQGQTSSPIPPSAVALSVKADASLRRERLEDLKYHKLILETRQARLGPRFSSEDRNELQRIQEEIRKLTSNDPSQMRDGLGPFSYERGLRRMGQRLGETLAPDHYSIAEFDTLAGRLREILRDARIGIQDDSAKNRIIFNLNRIAREQLGFGFTDLCSQ
jgi:hypothetical protein